MKRIQILGTGCPKCRKLAENAEVAAKALGLEKKKGVRAGDSEVARLVAKAKHVLAQP